MRASPSTPPESCRASNSSSRTTLGLMRTAPLFEQYEERGLFPWKCSENQRTDDSERERENIPQKRKGSPLFDWMTIFLYVKFFNILHPNLAIGVSAPTLATASGSYLTCFKRPPQVPRWNVETLDLTSAPLEVFKALDGQRQPATSHGNHHPVTRLESLSPTCPFDRSDSVSQEPARSHQVVTYAHGVGEKMSRELPWEEVFDDPTSPVGS